MELSPRILSAVVPLLNPVRPDRLASSVDAFVLVLPESFVQTAAASVPAALESDSARPDGVVPAAEESVTAILPRAQKNCPLDPPQVFVSE
jgi:hypothetical protein